MTISYTDTKYIAKAYTLTKFILGNKAYSDEQIPENRIFAQYHSGCTEEMRVHVVQELSGEKSKIPLVYAMIILSMELNTPHVRHVIHYMPQTSMEKYFQETGCAGTDCKPAKATLFLNKYNIKKTIQVLQIV